MLNSPAAQGWHTELPAPEYDPAGQAVQAEDPWTLNVPAEQVVHVAWPIFEYSPALQGKQEAEAGGEYVPAAQGKQRDGDHTVAVAWWVVVEENVPAGHMTQLFVPTRMLPAAQKKPAVVGRAVGLPEGRPVGCLEGCLEGWDEG